MKLAELSSCVTFVDPAGGKTALKKQRARQAIVTIAGDDAGHIFVRDAWCGRKSTEEFVERIFWTAKTFDALIGCEANAMQELFSDSILLLAKAKGVKLKLIPVYQPTRIEKDQRIRWILQPIIAYGRLLMLEGHEELKREIITFPQCRTKDLIDALASACTLLPAKTVERQKSDKTKALEAYLRRSHMDPRLIQRRLDELRNQERSPQRRLA